MNRRLGRMQLLASLALLTAIVSCESGGGTPTGPGSVTLEPAHHEVATFEYVRIGVRGTVLGSASYAGMLGDVAITARRTSDSTVVFQVPDIAAGEHVLRLDIGSRTAEATLLIQLSPPMESPTDYVADVDSALTFEVDSIEDWYAAQHPSLGRFLDAAAFATDIAMMRATLAQLQSDFAALSPAEQREAAMTILAYRNARAAAAAGPVLPMADGDEDFPQCQWPDVQTVEEMRTCRRQHRDAAVSTVKSVEQCDIDFDARWEAGDYDGAVGVNYIAYECMKARMLKLKREVAETVRASVRGFFGWDEGPVNTAFSRAAEPPFFAGSARVYEPPLEFYNLMADDLGNIPAATELGAVHQELSEGWNALNATFPTRFRQAPPWLHSLHELNSAPLDYDRSALRLGRVEPASIEARDTIVDNQWMLIFDAPRAVASMEIPFSFEVIYDGGEFGVDTTLVTSSLLTHPLQGEWDVQVELEVTGWRYTHQTRVDFTLPCLAESSWTGESIDYWNTAAQDTFVWRSDFPLRCAGGDFPLSSVEPMDFYDPSAPEIMLQDGQFVWGATFTFDGENLRVSGIRNGSERQFSATMEGRYTGDRWEGTYTYVHDLSALPDSYASYESGSGTFVAVRHPPEPLTP